jgi:hypothetical protein
MPQLHPFAAAPASKSRAGVVPKPAVTVYGYARVSTGSQSVDAQVRQLHAAGAGRMFPFARSTTEDCQTRPKRRGL